MAVLEVAEGKKEEREQNTVHRPRKICFVCTGNTCRSPMAAAVANHLALERWKELPALAAECVSPEPEAFSAGLAAIAGDPIAPNAVKALEEAGVKPIPEKDYRFHQAHSLTAEEAKDYDLLIGMTPDHVMQLLLQFPQYAGKITGMPERISDPYGGNAEVYRKCLEKITDGIKKLLFAGDSL